VFASRLREEKYHADKEHRMALSEALKTQAQLKNEMMAMVARLQVLLPSCFPSHTCLIHCKAKITP
jgi:Ser/Thr protein kinase RdoA (MazF antagonist)